MPIKDLPVMLQGYRVSVVEPPCPKVREDGSMATSRDGVAQFVIAVFMKLRAQQGQRVPKGEEVRVTLETDPGEGFTEGMPVELVQPRVSAYQMRTEDGRELSGISFKALGLKPAGPAPQSMTAAVGSASRGGEDK